jgi:hypothetical protein
MPVTGNWSAGGCTTAVAVSVVMAIALLDDGGSASRRRTYPIAKAQTALFWHDQPERQDAQQQDLQLNILLNVFPL